VRTTSRSWDKGVNQLMPHPVLYPLGVGDPKTTPMITVCIHLRI
jgi:hypothetical protein